MSRTREQVIWDFVQDWLRKAEGDLRASQHLLGLEQEDYFTVAFHAQQAAEKFLKAVRSPSNTVPEDSRHPGITGTDCHCGRTPQDSVSVRRHAYAFWS